MGGSRKSSCESDGLQASLISLATDPETGAEWICEMASLADMQVFLLLHSHKRVSQNVVAPKRP